MPAPAQGVFSFIVQSIEKQSRFDALVAAHVLELSRTHAAGLIREGLVTVNGQSVKAGYRVKTGDVIHGCIPTPTPVEILPTPMDLDVLFEDDLLIVINKPPGLVVHPAAGHTDDTLVNALLHHCPDLAGIGGQVRPGIVHRLDKDTSGVLVVAKNDQAQAALSQQFKDRLVTKTYLAVVKGNPLENSGCVDLPIGRHPSDRKKMSVASRKGRTAITLWTVRERFREAALLEVDLKTGRTHQIRVHCAAIGYPILGDVVYGRLRGLERMAHQHPAFYEIVANIQRQLLHAASLAFFHPINGQPCSFQAPLPQDMEATIQALRTLND